MGRRCPLQNPTLSHVLMIQHHRSPWVIGAVSALIDRAIPCGPAAVFVAKQDCRAVFRRCLNRLPLAHLVLLLSWHLTSGSSRLRFATRLNRSVNRHGLRPLPPCRLPARPHPAQTAASRVSPHRRPHACTLRFSRRAVFVQTDHTLRGSCPGHRSI